MKILYKGNGGAMSLQDANIQEWGSCIIQDDGTVIPAYRIVNQRDDCVTETITKATDAILFLLEASRETGGTINIKYNADDVDGDNLDRQTIFFDGKDRLIEKEKNAFWAAIKEAVERGDRLFDVEAWYAKHKEDAKTDD